VNLFQPDLLAQRRLVVAGALPRETVDLLSALGAELQMFESAADEDADQEWVRARAPVHTLVYDSRGAFAGGGGPEALRDALEDAWIACRAAANGALIPGEEGGKLILVAPASDAGEHAEPARAGLENLARTLSVEWARHRITAVMVAPGTTTSAEQLGQLLAYLCSTAGDYYSGCRIELGAVGS
jgi:NAD(P)-dependent dehydrogenase (short-subunit alcohol dehydrogenase family)